MASLLRALPSVSRNGSALDPAGSLPPAPRAAYAANWRFARFLFFIFQKLLSVPCNPADVFDMKARI